MKTLEVRNSFHRLSDKIDNEEILKKFYEILEKASDSKEGSHWNKLTSDEQ